MKVYAVNRKAMQTLTKQLRAEGYNIITYSRKLIELEKDGMFIAIEIRR